MEAKKFFFPGSFDPFTRGHFNIVLQALNLYETGVVAIGINNEKIPMFDLEARKEMVKEALAYYDKVSGKNISSKVSVMSYHGLIVEAAEACGADVIVRGARRVEDQAEEKNLRLLNEKLMAVRGLSLEQKLIEAPNVYTQVSSSAVRKLIKLGEYIVAQQYVLPPVHSLMMREELWALVKESFENLSEWLRFIRNEAFRDGICSRPFHNLSHIASMLNRLKMYQGRVEDQYALTRAIFFHDYILGDLSRSFEASGLCKKHYGLFEATDHLNLKRELQGDECLMHDFDLAVLSETATYADYRNNVRLEHKDMPLNEYITYRMGVLSKLMENFKFYVLNKKLEQTARENMEKEVAFWQNVRQKGLPRELAGLE